MTIRHIVTWSVSHTIFNSGFLNKWMICSWCDQSFEKERSKTKQALLKKWKEKSCTGNAMKWTNRHFLSRECVVYGIPHVIIILRNDWWIVFVDATACFTVPYPSSEDKADLHFNDFDNENFVSFMQKFTDLVVWSAWLEVMGFYRGKSYWKTDVLRQLRRLAARPSIWPFVFVVSLKIHFCHSCRLFLGRNWKSWRSWPVICSMVSQVDVLSDREKDILTNYDRLGFWMCPFVSPNLRLVSSLTDWTNVSFP